MVFNSPCLSVSLVEEALNKLLHFDSPYFAFIFSVICKLKWQILWIKVGNSSCAISHSSQIFSLWRWPRTNWYIAILVCTKVVCDSRWHFFYSNLDFWKRSWIKDHFKKIFFVLSLNINPRSYMFLIFLELFSLNILFELSFCRWSKTIFQHSDFHFCFA